MKRKIKLNKTRDAQEVIDDSVHFFKQNFKPLLKSYATICGFISLIGIILCGFFQVYFGSVFTSGTNNSGSSFYLIAIIEMTVYLFICITSLSYIALYIVKDNQAPTVDEVWSYFKFYLSRMMGSGALLFLGLIIATICFLLPGMYFMPFFFLIPVVMILENTSLSYAFSYSFRLLKGSWGNLFGVLLVTFFLMLAASIFITIPIMIISTGLVFLIGSNEVNLMMIGLNIAFHLVQFLYIFPFITTSLFYFNLLEKHENSSLLYRIQMIGKENEKQLSTTEEEEEY